MEMMKEKEEQLKALEVLEEEAIQNLHKTMSLEQIHANNLKKTIDEHSGSPERSGMKNLDVLDIYQTP